MILVSVGFNEWDIPSGSERNFSQHLFIGIVIASGLPWSRRHIAAGRDAFDELLDEIEDAP